MNLASSSSVPSPLSAAQPVGANESTPPTTGSSYSPSSSSSLVMTCRAMWQKLTTITHDLSQQLCEQVRPVISQAFLSAPRLTEPLSSSLFPSVFVCGFIALLLFFFFSLFFVLLSTLVTHYLGAHSRNQIPWRFSNWQASQHEKDHSVHRFAISQRQDLVTKNETYQTSLSDFDCD